MSGPDRRLVLKSALAAMVSSPALAQGYGQAGNVTALFPPVTARTVWLHGDDAPPDPAAMVRQLAGLQGTAEAGGGYLAGGAVAELERRFAVLLGKEDAAFFPTGTLANGVAIRLLCGDARRAICQFDSHVYRDESDAVQRLSGINLVPLTEGRIPQPDDLAKAISFAKSGPYPVATGAITLESPVRRLKGAMIPPESIAAMASLAAKEGIPMHLDGARLLLARPSLDIRAYAAPFRTVYVSLYKYLGAPFGAVLAGPHDLIAEARELRHIFGGTIYQGWAPAMLALRSLDSFAAEMARAHEAADALVDGLIRRGAVLRGPDMPSNIRLIEMPREHADAAFERCRAAGVHLARWADGVVPIAANRTILRRPVAEYLQLIAG